MGRRSPKQKFRPPNCPACLRKLPFSLRLFQGGVFFFRKLTENSEKSKPIWRDDLSFSFFEINKDLGGK